MARAVFGLTVVAPAFAQDGLDPSTPGLNADSNEVPVYVEYDKKVRTAEQVSPLASDLFGDVVSPYAGQTEFDNVDIDLPGNNALPVQLRRRFAISVLTEGQLVNGIGGRGNSYGGMGNWDIDVPHIYGVFDLQIGWDERASTGGPKGTPRCSNYFQPGTQTNMDGYIWSGNKVRIPGRGEREMLHVDASYPPTHVPSAMKNPQWTTREFDAFRCVPMANGTANGEGFVMTTTDGTSYYFDQYYTRQYPGVSLGSEKAGRKMIFLLASKVVDRYGNSVSYLYNGNGHPTSISSSDGRTITLMYDSSLLAAASVSSTSPVQTRTWHYGYTWTQRDGARLTSVTLPDPDNLSKWQYDYTSLNPNDEYLYAAYTAVDDSEMVCSGSSISGGRFNFKITHPSGAEGTFQFALKRFNRGMPSYPPNCTMGPGGNRIYNKPPHVDSFALTEKTIKNTTDAAGLGDTWKYQYRIGSGDICQNHNCDRVTNRILQPDGSAIDSTYSARFDATSVSAPAGATIEGSLLKTEYWRVPGDTDSLRKEEYAYVTGPDVLGAPFTDQVTNYPFASRYGSGGNAEDDASGSIRPLKKVTITQQGATFIREIQSFDSYARPVTAQMASSLNTPRVETTAYLDDVSNWVLGLVDSRTSPSFSRPIIKNYYDSKRNLTSVEEFGVLKRSMTYRTDGTLLTVNDGTNTTTLGTFKRGIPQSVTYADGTSQSASVSYFGDILSVTDENGYATTYEYDPLSRLKRIIYPAGDNNGTGWNDTRFDYAFVGADSTVGLSVSHWRQTRTTGQGKKITHYDQRLRPAVTEEYDAANRTGTLRYTLRRFDHANRETFVSYPSPTFVPPTGTTTQYDALGRVVKVMQDSELGALTTQTSYLAPFKKQVIDPKNNVTTTEFYAYDTPSEDAPRKIAAPQGVTIDIVRDTLGKPLSVQRSGSYAGSAVSQIRRYVYDSADQRLCKTTEPESGATIQDYDAAGNVSWSVKGSSLLSSTSCDRTSVPNYERTHYNYDGRNRLTVTGPPQGTSPVMNSYWPDGALKTTWSNAAKWEYTYNKRRLLESESLLYDGQSFLLGWGYDANGSTKQLMYPDDTVIDFAPNALGQPTQAGSYANGVTYFANGAVKGFTYGNNIAHSLTQNTRQLPQRSKDGTVADVSYSYDKNANVSAITDSAQAGLESRTMTYDGLDRLSTANAPGLWGNATFGYDPLDNIRTSSVGIRSCTHAFSGTANRLTSVAGTNCPTLNYAYDVSGNVTARGSQGFVFDKLDRLTNATGKQTYVYDGLGRRVSVAPANGTGKLYQVYSKEGQLLFAWDAATDKSTNYVYLNGSLVARSETNPEDIGPPPPPPPGVSPNPSPDGNYTVTWQAVGGATGYVLSEVANGGAETAVYTGAATSWSPPSPKTNGSYVYRVQACATVCGNFSGTTTETVQIGAGALTVTPPESSTGNYTVSWAAVPGAASYVLTESVNGGAATSVYSGTALSWAPPAAKPDGSYVYRLQTCSGTCGPSGAAATATVTTEVPGGLGASPNPNTTGNYTVSWSSVASAVTYRLEEKTGNGTWGGIQVSAGLLRAISGKPVGTYQYRVRACRHATSVSYCGAYSAELTVEVDAQMPPIPAPPASIGGSPNPSTNGAYTVTWAESTGATSYTLQEMYCYKDLPRDQQACTAYQTVTTQSGRSWTPTPKTAYGDYYYQVKASNGAGSSAYRESGPVRVRLPNVLPERMVIGGMSSPNPSTNGLYTVNWSASARVERYELQEMSSDPTWTNISTTLTGTSWTTPTAKPSGYYYYRGRACNVYGCSEYSVSSQTAIVQIPAPVAMPTNFRVQAAVAVGQPSKFRWDPVSGASHYDLKEEQVSCPTNLDGMISIPANEAQPYIIFGEVPDCHQQPVNSVTYRYSLRACSGATCSGWSPTVTFKVTKGAARPGGTATYIHTDGLRSPVAETNGAGTVTSRMRYEPYGAPTTGSQAPGPGYTGHVWDDATGLSYMQQRYYDPIGGRFLSTDPIAANPASFNRYAYANNNPYKNIDPDGRNPVLVFALIAGIDWLSRPSVANAPAPGDQTFSNTMTPAEAAMDVASVLPAGKLKEAVRLGVKAGDKLSQNAAAREAKRQAGIPTSQQPSSQTNGRASDGTPVGRQQSYEVPAAGGGTESKSVQVSRDTRGDHAGMSQIEAGTVKPEGQTDVGGRPRIQNVDKVRVDFDPKR